VVPVRVAAPPALPAPAIGTGGTVSGSTSSSPGAAVVVVVEESGVVVAVVVVDDSTVVDDSGVVVDEAWADAAPAAVSVDAVNRAASSRARIGAA
jgi:hypothetical protein